MDWKYVRPLDDAGSIEEYQSKENISFPEGFIQCVRMNNGGKPVRSGFDTDITGEHQLKTFLSFNRNDRENIWDFSWSDDLSGSGLVPFAMDVFGNLICFRKGSSEIIFLDHESGSEESAAADFDSFMKKLK